MSFKEFLQAYGWGLAVIAVIVIGIVIAVTINLPNNSDNQIEFDPVVEPIADINFSVEHLALAGNQQLIFDKILALDGNHQLILTEIQKLNLFSQCVIDTENIVTREIPIDEFGGFGRVSIVTLVCPELIR